MPPAVPDPLYVRIFALGQFTFPHRDRPDQTAAKNALHHVLAHEDATRLPTALRDLGRAFSTDCRRQHIPLAKSWLTSRAYHLADEVEQLLEDRRPAACLDAALYAQEQPA